MRGKARRGRRAILGRHGRRPKIFRLQEDGDGAAAGPPCPPAQPNFTSCSSRIQPRNLLPASTMDPPRKEQEKEGQRKIIHVMGTPISSTDQCTLVLFLLQGGRLGDK